MGTRPAEKALQKMNEEVFAKLEKLFRTCHAMAKHNRPFSDFVWQCQLDKAKGLDVGATYINDKSARSSTQAIAETERANIKRAIERNKFASILSDGATDCSVTENEIVYVRICERGVVSVKFMGCMATEKADAKGIFNALKRAVESIGLEWEELLKKLVALGSDGASVMMGARKGVAALLKEKNPSIIGIHCFGHRLELAYKESLAKVDLGDKVVTLLMGLYYFYHNSPLNRSNLKNSFKALGKKAVTPTRVGGTRWVGHVLRALTNLFKGYEAVVQHLQQLGEDPKASSVAKSKAKCFLKLLTKKDVMQFASFLHDVVSALSIMSKVFQRKDGTAADIHRSLKNVLSVLDDYRTCDGPYLAKMKSGVLCHSATGSLVQFPSARANLLTSLGENLKKRFADSDTGVINSTSIVDLGIWPVKEKMKAFGDKEVVFIVKHYEESLVSAGVDVDSVQLEWTLLKNDLYSGNDAEEIKNLSWREINQKWRSQYENILAVIDLLLCLPSSSTECERGFSLMKNIKTNVRNSLKENSLCDFMVIQLESPAIESFDPTQAIHHWNQQVTRARRPFLKDAKKLQRQAPVLAPEVRETIEVDAPTAADSQVTEGDAPTAVESQDPVESDAPTATESEETTEMQEQEEARVEARKESDYEDSGYDSGMESAESDCDDNEETVNRKLIHF